MRSLDATFDALRQHLQSPDALKLIYVEADNGSQVPLSAYLGAVGMPGVTAWYGLMKICQPKAGQTIVVLEAMKMENHVTAHQAGTVSGVNVKEGDTVPTGATIATIEAT